MPTIRSAEFINTKIDIKLKLSALWAVTIFCYIYGDYFALYIPGKLTNMIDGQMGPLGPVTQGVLIGTSIMMAIPSLMVFLSLVMKPQFNRWLNIIFGIIFALIMMLAIQGTWSFYKFFGFIEIGLCSAIVVFAWKWPRNPSVTELSIHDNGNTDRT